MSHPRPCRYGRHPWEFREALPMILWADGTTRELTFHACRACHLGLELGGDLDVGTRKVQHVYAAVWTASGGVTPGELAGK